MKDKNFLNLLVCLALFVIFVVGCSKPIKTPIEEMAEEVVDTGVLVIKSSPESALVYVDDEFKGSTPLNLYNFPAGPHNILIKKDGYDDFEKVVTLKVGKTEEIEATLVPIKISEEKPVQEEKQVPSEPEDLSKPALNKINLTSFAMYYDFDKMQFTELRTERSDLFSRRYDTYVHFTALTPTKINVLNIPINEVKKEDCIFADDAVTTLFSKQTLCAKTGEGTVVAIGGIWQTIPTELEFVIFN